MSHVDEVDGLHRRVWDLIPWVLNNTATESERREVEAHVQDCAGCREEFEFHQQLQGRISRGNGLTGNPRPALNRLWMRIDEQQPMPAAWQRPARPAWLVPAMACLVLLQAAGLALTVSALWGRDDRAPAYHTLTSAVAPLPPASIRMVPVPALSAAELQRLLQENHLQIVAGPNEAGAYALAQDGRIATAAVLARLRSNAGVRFAEPIAAGG